MLKRARQFAGLNRRKTICTVISFSVSPRRGNQRPSTECRAAFSARRFDATFRGASRSNLRRGNASRLSALGLSSRSRLFAKYLGSHPLCASLCPPCGNQVHAASMDRLFSPRGALRPLRGKAARALDLRSARLPSESSLRSSSTAHHRSPFSLRTTQPPFSGTANTVRIDSVDFTWSVVRLIRCSDDSSL